MKSYFIPIKKFHDEPYSKIIGFPNGTKNQIKKKNNRIRKIKSQINFIFRENNNW